MTEATFGDRLVLIANTHRVAPGLLSWPAWHELRAGPVFTGTSDHVQLPFLQAADVSVAVLENADPRALAFEFRDRARGGQAVWLAGPGGDPAFVRALGDLAAREGGIEMEVVYGSYDMPGARLLDLVSTMDRLRSPGGCPWDAEQTHESLAHYLVEETYEAIEAIEDGDLAALRDELGDVLLQVVFHSRVASERTDGSAWTIDDVAAGIVDKLVRRHPHVFGDVAVSGAAEVVTNWERIKARERKETGEDDAEPGPFDGIAFGQPALTLAAKLQKRAAQNGVDVGAPPEPTGVDVSAPFEQSGVDVGALAQAEVGAAPAAGVAAAPAAEVAATLWSTVARARELGVDPEAALRAYAREVRARHTPTPPRDSPS